MREYSQLENSLAKFSCDQSGNNLPLMDVYGSNNARDILEKTWSLLSSIKRINLLKISEEFDVRN
jgi:hypothetical protein